MRIGLAIQVTTVYLGLRKFAFAFFPYYLLPLQGHCISAMPTRSMACAPREAGQVLATVRAKIEARVEKLGTYDAHNRMLLRDELKKWRAHLKALELLAAPVGQAERDLTGETEEIPL